MPTREEMIAALRGQTPAPAAAPSAAPSRAEMIAALRGQQSTPQAPPPQTPPPEESGIHYDGKGDQAFLQGFGQGGTLGYLNEIQARVAQPLSAVLPQSMGGNEGFKASPYDELKKQFAARDASLKKSNPVASTVGNIAGAVMTLPAGGAVAKEASLAAKLGRAALTGGTYGGLQNTDVESTAADPHAELKARLLNAGVGGVLGAAGEGVVAGAGSFLAKRGEKLAQQAVIKQVGANAGQIKKIIQKPGEMQAVEGLLVNENLMKPGNSVESVAEHTKKILNEDGPKIGKMYQDAQAASEAQQSVLGMNNSGTKIDGNELADQILENTRAKFKSHANRDLVMKEMETAVGPLRDMGENANIVDVHDFRKSLDENVNWGQKSQERDAIQNAYIDARNQVADKTQNVIDQLDKNSGGNSLEELKALNKRYSAASTVNNISTQAQGREMAKALMGHGVIGGGAGVGAGYLEYKRSHDPLKAIGTGLAVGAGVTAARKYGAPAGFYSGRAMRGAGEVIKAVGQHPGEIGAGVVSPWLQMSKDKKNGR
jgi:hypothetical protein